MRARWLQILSFRLLAFISLAFIGLTSIELAFPASALAQAAAARISGDVVALDGGTLQLKTRTGQLLSIRLAEKMRVMSRAASDLTHLATGMYVGTTAKPQPDGTLLASQISVFPEAQRGTGEGHGPMDSLPGSTMTNATVSALTSARAPGSTMTNATVAQVAGFDHALKLTLKYAGGEQVVMVPDATPIIVSEIADRSLLTPGAHVVVYASRQPDGSLVSERISVGKNGMVPVS